MPRRQRQPRAPEFRAPVSQRPNHLTTWESYVKLSTSLCPADRFEADELYRDYHIGRWRCCTSRTLNKTWQRLLRAGIVNHEDYLEPA